MSYILDALRRADAERERERGAVPGLHAKPVTIDAPPEDRAARRLPWVPVAVGGGIALVGLAALVGWLRPAAVATPTSAPAPVPAVTAAAPAPVFVPPPAPPTPVPVPPLAVVPPQPPPPAAAVAGPPPAPAKPRADKADRVDPPPRSEKAPPKPAASPGPPATPLAQLPPEVRSQLPPMAVGGWIYSDSPASRFVMINGQIVREGEPAATGVVLERIGPKSAVLRWREWRIEVPL